MDAVDRYLEHRARLGLSQRTIGDDALVLRQLQDFLQKPIEKAKAEDLHAYLDSRNLAPRSERARRYKLQLFYKWLKKPIDLPTMKRPRDLPVQPSDLVSEADVYAMIEAFDHPRNKAILAVTYESATRAGEILGLRVKDITFEGTHARIKVAGKTGERIIPIVWSTVYLQQWLNYVGSLQPEDVIWRTPSGTLSYVYFYQLITSHSKKVLGRKVHPHILRHSRITYLVKHPQISTAVICELAGWKQGSQILQTYIHLAGADVENAILAIHDKQPVEVVEKPFKPRRCLRCSTENPPEAKYCSQCSLILDEVEAQRLIERDAIVDQFLEYLVENPEKVQELATEMRKSKKPG